MKRWLPKKYTLILLVESLSKGERKALTQILKKEGETTHYFRLFETLCNFLKSKQGTLEEKHLAIEAVLPKEIKEDKNIKRRLKEKILDYLIKDKFVKSKMPNVAKELNSYEILLERRLYTELDTKIKERKKYLKNCEEYAKMIDLLECEMQLLLKKDDKNILEKLEDLVAEKKHYHQLYQLEQDYSDLYKQVNLLLKKDLKLKQIIHKEKFQELIQTEILSEDFVQPYISQGHIKIISFFYRLKSIEKRTQGNHQEAYQYINTLASYFKNNDRWTVNHETLYTTCLCSLSRACYYLRDEDTKAQELKDILETLDSINTNDAIFESLEAKCDIGVLFYIESGQFDKAFKLVQEIDENWDLFEKNLDGKIVFYSYICFFLYWLHHTTHPEQMKNWAERTFRLGRIMNTRKQRYAHAILLQLTNDCDAALEEQKEGGDSYVDLLENRMETTIKTLKNNQTYNQAAKIFIKQIKQLIKHLRSLHRNKEELIQKTLEDLKTQLLSLDQKAFVPPSYEILIWCQSRLSQKPRHHIHQNFENIFEC